MEWIITDFDLDSPAGSAMETSASKQTHHSGSNPQAMKGVLMGTLNQVLEQITIPSPAKGSKDLCIPFKLQDSLGRRIEGIFKETYTYGQIEELKQKESERLAITKTIQDFAKGYLELLSKYSNTLSVKIDQGQGKLAEIVNQMVKMSNNKAIMEQYCTKIQQIKHKLIAINDEFKTIITKLNGLTPGIESEIIQSVDDLLRNIPKLNPIITQVVLSTVRKCANATIHEQLDKIRLGNLTTTEILLPKAIIKAIGNKVGSTLETTSNNHAKQLWGNIRDNVTVAGPAAKEFRTVVQQARNLQMIAISQRGEAKTAQSEIEKLHKEVTEASDQIEHMMKKLDDTLDLEKPVMDNTPHQSRSGLQQFLAEQEKKATATSMSAEQRQWFNQSFQEARQLIKQLPSSEEYTYFTANRKIVMAIGTKKKPASAFTEEERKLITIHQKLRKQKPNQAALKTLLDNIVIRLGKVKIAPHRSEIERVVDRSTARSLAQNSALASHNTTASKGAAHARGTQPN